ncbi:MAG: prolyl oligopeptidase family serine peptidase [Cyclobacteriaceae bacterium]
MSSLCLLVSLQVAAQKKPLTHSVYDEWKSISTSTMSGDGQHVVYVVSPQEGDNMLYVRNVKQQEEQTFARGENPEITYDSRFLAFKVAPQYDSVRMMKLQKVDKDKMPKDSLFVMNLGSGDVYRHERVKSYKLPEKASGWLAFLLEEGLPEKDTTETDTTATAEKKKADKKGKGNELVLLKLDGMEEQRFEGVDEYLFSENGSQLIFSRVEQDSVTKAAVFSFDTETERLSLLDSGKATYKRLALSDDGSRAAFLATEDSTKAEERFYSLYLWDNTVQQVADTASVGISENWMVSEHETPFFSEDASRLFFGTSPRPEKYDYEEDTTILEEKRVSVDVWSWKDDYIQPMQQLQAEEEKKRAYMTMYDISQQRIVPLADEEMPEMRMDPEKRLPYAIGISDLFYRQQISWDYPSRRDIYLVNLENGERTLIAERATGYPAISPAAKYAYWYEAADSSWMAYEIASGETRNLTEAIDVNFYDELNDIPALPGSYGSAGWTEEDEHFLVYDYYDIWKIDPKTLKPENLTDGYGRQNEIALRYQKLDPDEYFIPANDEILLEAFHRSNKQSGFFREHTGRKKAPEKLVMDNYGFYFDEKARTTDDLIFRKSSFTDYPDIWYSTLDFKQTKKISTANPQQEDYLWGEVELMSWKGTNGEDLQGLLYKPENFDPNGNYPMLVYFYERSSDRMHSHRTPSPSASTINIPYFVSNGYVVFVPDIVYEEGYPGRSAYDCIVPGVLKVVDMGFVDEDKIGIQGQSWGGYQVAYLITRTDMFAAAMAGAPVANMTSAYGGVRWGTGMSRMFQYERTQSRLGGTLWEKPRLYIENSPLFYANDIKTPLLMMHNDADSAVPWYQGIEFFMALRRLQQPVWMLVYNEEVHNLRERKNRKDLSIRMSQFFDYYLKGEPMPVWMEKGIPAKLKGRTLRYELSDR